MEIILICKSVIFHSLKDEDAFFQWLYTIKSIAKIDGVHDELYLHIKRKVIPDNDLREIISLFYRYKINMKQLQIFLTKKNKRWFFDGNVKGYWHRRVFGS